MNEKARYGRGSNIPHTERQEVLETFKSKFRASTKYGTKVLDYLQRSACGVWRCEQDSADKRRWWLNITLPENVAEMFDAHSEIQLVYVDYEEVEPRLLQLVQDRTSRNARLDQGLFIVASLDHNLERLLRRRRGEFAAVSLHLDELSQTSDDLRAQMSDVLTTVDHYDITKPVHNAGGFFGRTNEIHQLVSAIERGQSTGVFGLRKTGKTSLLNYVATKRKQANRPVVWVDISGLSGADDFRVRILENTWNQLSGALPKGDQLPRLRTLTRNGELKVDLDILRLHWLKDLETLAQHSDGRLEIFIDEIDQINPGRSHFEEGAADMLKAATQLRGMIQNADTGSGMVLICAGVDPDIFENPLNPTGSDNLMYKLVQLMYLSPLSRDEMAEMVRDLGRRMGIRIRDHQVIDYLFAEYGGHALLTRKACSLASKTRAKDQIPWHMSVSAIEAASTSLGADSPLKQAAEILTSFKQWFPDEAELLYQMWSSVPDDRELAEMQLEEDPSSLEHARYYGIIESQSVEPRIRAVKRSVIENG